MEQFSAYVQKHKSISYILGISVLAFINCCGFLILNLNKEWLLMITAAQIYVVSAGALLSGVILAGYFLLCPYWYGLTQQGNVTQIHTDGERENSSKYRIRLSGCQESLWQ